MLSKILPGVTWFCKASCMAAAITGPSAIGSLNGKPISMMSAPAASIDFGKLGRLSGVGCPPTTKGISALVFACRCSSKIRVIRLRACSLTSFLRTAILDVLVPNGCFQIHVMDVGDGGQPSKDIRELFGEVLLVFFALFGIGEGRRQLANFFSQPQKSAGNTAGGVEAWYRSRMSFWNSAMRMAWLRDGGGGEKRPRRGSNPQPLPSEGSRSIQLSYSDWIVHPSVETGVKGVQSRRETANIGPLSEDPWYAPTDDQWQSV